MTSEEFQSRYRLLTQVADGEVRSYHAIAPSGSVVMAHFLQPDTRNENRKLLALVDSLSPAAKQRVLKVSEVDGAPVVVTRFILEFETLPRWLRANAVVTDAALGAQEPELPDRPEPLLEEAGRPEQPASLEEPEREELHPPSTASGEFSQLFRIPSMAPLPATGPGASEVQPPAEGVAEEAAFDVEPEPAEPPRVSSGEFTQLFRRPLIEEQTASAPRSPPQDVSSGTQEFANLFRRADVEIGTTQIGKSPAIPPPI